MNHYNEETLRKPVHEYFQEKNYSIYDEPRLFTRRIDIIAVRRNKVVAVELKMRRWKKAIQQAYLNLRVTDYSYIALPEVALGRIDTNMYYEAYNWGIGILSVDGTAKQIMRPKRSKKIQPLLRRSFVKSLSRS